MPGTRFPQPKKDKHLFHEHGSQREDPYFWMNKRDSKEVLEHIEDENRYTLNILAPIDRLKNEIFNEIKGRIKEDEDSVPYLWKGFWYHFRFRKGLEYPVHYRKRDNENAKEEKILDVNLLAKDQSYCDVGELAFSPDHNWMAYSLDIKGRRQYDIFIKDLQTGEVFETPVKHTDGEIEWSNDSKYLFYVSIDPVTLRSGRVFRYPRMAKEIGTEIYHEKEEAFHLSVASSKSGKYIFISSSSTLSSEYLTINSNDPLSEPIVFRKREPDHLYFIDHLQDLFYIKSNENAINFQILTCNEDKTEDFSWQMFLGHRPSVLLEDFELFNDFIIVEEREKGLTRFHKIHLSTMNKEYIQFPDPVYTVSIDINEVPGNLWFRYHFSSLTVPNSIIETHLESGKSRTLKQQEIVGGHNPSGYTSKRIFAQSHDGAEVPVSLVYKKGIKLDGSNPLLLYGYGSYGISMDPYFNVSRLSLLDRGFVFAIAHIRGGEELGREWYENGKLLHKKNTFLDFIACGELMVELKYTSPDNLYAMGGSAGGLLIGAVINMRPELFKGVIAAVPFVDIITTMMDDSIPLTTLEYDEWGNPNQKDYYNYMLSYSPYDNISDQCYPAVLAATGYHDSQVQYWEPLKWVAKLRDHQQCSHPILMHTNTDAGHGGSSGRFERYKEVALYYAFLLFLSENHSQSN